MEQNCPDPNPSGTALVLDLIKSLLDPDSPQPNLPHPTRNERIHSLPIHIEHLATQMATATRERVSEQITQLQRQMFLLTDGQLRTLNTLHIPPETYRTITRLNGMVKVTENHSINDRLEIIGQLPSTPEGHQGPDWETWWFNHRDSHMGIHRPHDHDPAKDPISESLNTAIARIAHRAVQHIPDHPSIARRLSNQPDRKKHAPLALSEVWTTAVRIRKLAGLIGLSNQDIITNWGRDSQDISHSTTLAPERILAEVPDLVADMGSITDLLTLKSKLPAKGADAVLADTNQAIWYHKDVRDSHLIGPAPATRWIFDHSLQDLPPTISKAERELIQITTPLHPNEAPALINTHDRASQAIAFINKNTPKATRDYLNGDSDDPTPPNPQPCPMASVCPTPCGRLQQSGEFPFPLNDDGDYQKCQYWQFLGRHQHSDPVLRDLAAVKIVQDERQQQDQEFKKQHREDNTIRPNPTNTPETPEKAPQSPPSADRTKQASLF